MEVIARGNYATIVRSEWNAGVVFKFFHPGQIASAPEYWRRLSMRCSRLAGKYPGRLPKMRIVEREDPRRSGLGAGAEDLVLELSHLPGKTLASCFGHEPYGIIQGAIEQIDVLVRSIHRHGYAHNDISAENILVQVDRLNVPFAALVDWDGLSGPGIPARPHGLEVGSTGYMSAGLSYRDADDFALSVIRSKAKGE